MSRMLTLSCTADQDPVDLFVGTDHQDDCFDIDTPPHDMELDLQGDNLYLDFPAISHMDTPTMLPGFNKTKPFNVPSLDNTIDVMSEVIVKSEYDSSGTSDYGSDVSFENESCERSSSPSPDLSSGPPSPDLSYKDFLTSPRFYTEHHYHSHPHHPKQRKYLSQNHRYTNTKGQPCTTYRSYNLLHDQVDDVKKRLKDGNLLPREEMNLLRLSCTCNARNTGKGTHLWEFLLEMLADKRMKSIITWTGRAREFKVINSREVAREWGNRKNKPHMNFDKMSRAMRYYYKKDILTHGNKQRLVYSFGKTSICPHYDKILQVALKTRPNLPESDSHLEQRPKKIWQPPKIYQPPAQIKLNSVNNIRPKVPSTSVSSTSHERSHHTSRIKVFRPQDIENKRTMSTTAHIIKPKIPLRNLHPNPQKSGCFEFDGI